MINVSVDHTNSMKNHKSSKNLFHMMKVGSIKNFFWTGKIHPFQLYLDQMWAEEKKRLSAALFLINFANLNESDQLPSRSSYPQDRH